MRFNGIALAGIVVLAACTSGQPLREPASATASLRSGASPARGQQAPAARRGRVFQPGEGERFTYCARPLSLTLKVDSETIPGAMFVAGIGELHGDEGIGRHRTDDEVLYIIRGWGHAVLGGDTVPLGPGSMAYVPPGVPHRIVSTPSEPLHYFFVLTPGASGDGFRRAARIACPAGATPTSGVAPAGPASPSSASAEGLGRQALALAPLGGERVNYCGFPLVITTKVDAESAPGSRLTAATGTLRRGSEIGTHAGLDELVYVTHGRGRAFIGSDTVVVAAGSVTYVPGGVTHGFINEGDDTLEYVVVYAAGFSREGFRALAKRPGPYCPETTR